MFEFPEHPIPLAEESVAVTVFEPIRISKTVLLEVVNGEPALMLTPRSSMVTCEPEMPMEFEEEPVTTRLGSCAG
jgi:hypothetical protein